MREHTNRAKQRLPEQAKSATCNYAKEGRKRVVTRDVPAELGDRAGQHEQRRLEGERGNIMTDYIE